MEKYAYLLKKQFADFAAGKSFVAFDTETTGLHPDSDRIIEIGAVRFSIKGEEAVFSKLLYPGILLPSFCTQLTGITNKDLFGQPEFSDICDSFLEFCSGATLVAHNAGFDVSFMNSELAAIQKPALKAPLVPAVDTVRVSRTVFPGLKCYKLQALAEHFEIPPGNAHRATDDARVCMELFLRAYEASKTALN